MAMPPKCKAETQSTERDSFTKESQAKKNGESDRLGIGLKYKLQIDSTFPRRPLSSETDSGRVIKLVSNFLKFDISRENFYQYDVFIENKKRSSLQLRSSGTRTHLTPSRNSDVVEVMLRGDPSFENLLAIYDGIKILYTNKPLNISNTPLECTVKLQSKTSGDSNFEDFVIKIWPTFEKGRATALYDGLSPVDNQCNTNQVNAMVTQTILSNLLSHPSFPFSFFIFRLLPIEHIPHLGEGIENSLDYHQQCNPVVKFNRKITTCYRQESVLEYIAEVMGINISDFDQLTLEDKDITLICKEIRNLIIVVNHLSYKRKYRVLGLTHDSADKLKFEIDVSKRKDVTVADYFDMTYNRKLRYAHLPCIQVNPKNKGIYLPIEICDVVERQRYMKKLEKKQNIEINKLPDLPPISRFENPRDKWKMNEAYLKELGLKVHHEYLRLEGRVLGPPSILYKESKIIPNEGSWNMRESQFFKGAVVDKWVLLSFGNPRRCNQNHLERFATLFVKFALKSGIVISTPELVDSSDYRTVPVQKVLGEIKQKYHASLAIIVVPGGNSAIYCEIKNVAERVVGLTTQCVTEFTVSKIWNPSIIQSICQKINAKMGGINNSIGFSETLLQRPAIIISAVLSHPSQIDSFPYSIASVVGSLDRYTSRYAVTYRAQSNIDHCKQSTDTIQDLKSMIKELLAAFYKNCKGKIPEQIIFYRGGVGESQLEVVRDNEIRSIREACKEFRAGYEPGITFIVVQQRHQVRFAPENTRDGVERFRSIPPGTVVDNTVVHPLHFDFFLCSHFVQGTSRPSRYTVLVDDNSFSADDLYKLTFYLCHTYTSCTKSISIPTSLRYAQHASSRARQYIQSILEDKKNDMRGSEFFYSADFLTNAIKVKENLKDTMYFV